MGKEITELQTEIDKIDFEGGLDESPTPAPAPVEPAAKSEPTSEPEVKPEPEPQDAVPTKAKPKELTATDDPTPEPKTDEPAAEETKAIPDSHYRAALHMGYTPEEIGALYDANPDLALKTVAKAYESVNAVSRQLGELGQRARQIREQPP
ncbi:MAG: hypothetical protein ABFE01_04445, partial [Phycisphaerales bacterium]